MNWGKCRTPLRFCGFRIYFLQSYRGPSDTASVYLLFLFSSNCSDISTRLITMDFDSLKTQVSNLTLYDVKAGIRKVQNGKQGESDCHLRL